MRRQSPAVRQGGRLTPTRRESSRRQRARPVRSGATHRRPCEKPDENWAGHEKPQLMISSWSIPKELTKKKSPGCSSDGRATCQGQEGRWFKSTHPDDGTHHLTHDVSSLEEQWCPRDPVCTPPDTPAIPKLGNGQEVSARYVRENPRSSDAVLAIAANPRSRARFTFPDNMVRRRQNPRLTGPLQ